MTVLEHRRAADAPEPETFFIGDDENTQAESARFVTGLGHQGFHWPFLRWGFSARARVLIPVLMRVFRGNLWFWGSGVRVGPGGLGAPAVGIAHGSVRR